MTLTWIAADGDLWPLGAGQPVEALAGLAGVGMPAQDQAFAPDAGGHGSTLLLTRHQAREVVVPVRMDRVQVPLLARALEPGAGDGTLRWEDPDDGRLRDLVCRYAGGMEIVHDLPRLRRPVLLFRTSTPDPFWRDTHAATATYEAGDVGLWLPWPPITVVPDDVLASPSIHNGGDVEAWPLWTVTGPATSVTLINQTTGRSLTIDTALAAGETLTIDTRPGAKTVTDEAGTNRYEDLAADDDDLWPLAIGSNSVTIAIIDATAQSQVGLTWQRRWLTA